MVGDERPHTEDHHGRQRREHRARAQDEVVRRREPDRAEIDPEVGEERPFAHVAEVVEDRRQHTGGRQHPSGDLDDPSDRLVPTGRRVTRLGGLLGGLLGGRLGGPFGGGFGGHRSGPAGAGAVLVGRAVSRAVRLGLRSDLGLAARPLGRRRLTAGRRRLPRR
ncbi:hypothetical protein E1287_25215 [Actinomadura sp. KC06]|nr:hypothetical protein E1287_25215 [Actinomadura sp. KC06]